MRQTFGRWLLGQRDRGDWVDQVAETACADHTFPVDGSPSVIRKHFRDQQAGLEAFQALEGGFLSKQTWDLWNDEAS